MHHWRFVRQCARRRNPCESSLVKRRALQHASRTDQHDGFVALNIGLQMTARAPYHGAILAPTPDNVAKSSLAASNFRFSYATSSPRHSNVRRLRSDDSGGPHGCCDEQAMSAPGHERRGGASCRSSHVRNAPLATVVQKRRPVVKGQRRHCWGPTPDPADCGDNNFTAVAQIWYRFHGVRKN